MPMYKVIKRFKDKYNLQHFYNVGDNFDTEDKVRIKDLLNRKLISKDEKKTKEK